MPEMHKSTAKVQTKLHAVGSYVQTNSKPAKTPIRKTVHPAKHKIDTVQSEPKNDPNNTKRSPRKPINNNEHYNSSRQDKKVVEKSSDSKSSETNLPRYVSHDEPNCSIQHSPVPWQQQQASKSRSSLFSGKKPEDISPESTAPKTKPQLNSETRVNNEIEKMQTTSDADIGRVTHSQFKHNRHESISSINTNKSAVTTEATTEPQQTQEDFDTNSVNTETTTVGKDKHSPSNVSSTMETLENPSRHDTSFSSPSTSPECTATSLKSRKSVLSVGSMTSHVSLADRILELRSQSSGSVSSLRSSVSQPENMSFRPETTMLRAGSSKSDTAMDVKAMKKHLPDLKPRGGENSSPVVRRRSRRKILQS